MRGAAFEEGCQQGQHNGSSGGRVPKWAVRMALPFNQELAPSAKILWH